MPINLHQVKSKRIVFDKLFLKHYQQRISTNRSLSNKFESRVDLFLKDRKNPVLKDHKLRGIQNKYRSFSVAGDCRIIYYEEKSDIIFVFVDIGTHNQVYR